MAFLNIETYGDVEVQTAGAQRNADERVGGRRRSFSGQLRSQVRAAKRIWSFTTGPLSLTDANALRAAIALDARRDCSGDAIGGIVECMIEVGDSPYVPDDDNFKVFLTLTLTEV